MSITEGSALELALIWLDSALKCENFKWDGQQHDAASETLEEAKTELMRLRFPPEPRAEHPDTARLDFVLRKTAWLTESVLGNHHIYQLLTQDEDENFIELSQWFESPREAIDHAMSIDRQQLTKGESP
jgi:hypothetical protein